MGWKTSRITKLQPPHHMQGHQPPYPVPTQAAHGPIQPGLEHLRGWMGHPQPLWAAVPAPHLLMYLICVYQRQQLLLPIILLVRTIWYLTHCHYCSEFYLHSFSLKSCCSNWLNWRIKISLLALSSATTGLGNTQCPRKNTWEQQRAKHCISKEEEKALAINTCYCKIPMSKKTPTKLRSQDLFASAAPENVWRCRKPKHRSYFSGWDSSETP